MTAASKKPSWKALLAALLMGGAGAACGFLIAKFGMEMPLVRASLKALSAWDLLMLPVLIVVVLAIHEAGHLAGGMSRGMRFLLFIAGPFGLVRTQEGIRFRWFFNLGTLGGIAAALPKSGQPLKPQLARLIVGGPLASLLLAFAALGLFWLFEGRAGAYALVTSLLSTAIFLVTAAPFRAGGFMSDGMQLLQLHRDPTMVERRARLISLGGMSMAGTRPRDLDRVLLAEAQAMAGKETMCDVGVWLYSYGHALDQGDTTGAGQWLDRIEAVIDDYPDGFRQGIALEIALFEALHRRRLPQAQAWLARGKGGIVDASRRALALAAVEALSGRQPQAQAALLEAERQLGRGMDAGFAKLSVDQIAAIRRHAVATSSITQAA